MLIIAVDASYLEFGACRKWNIRIDYEKLARKIVSETQGVKLQNTNKVKWRMYVYCDNPDESGSENYQNFVNYLSYLPNLILRFGACGDKTFMCTHCKMENQVKVQKVTDVMVVMDAMRLFKHNLLDKYVLVAGDRDFAMLLETLQFEGVHVSTVSIEGSQASELRNASDCVLTMDVNNYENFGGFRKEGFNSLNSGKGDTDVS